MDSSKIQQFFRRHFEWAALLLGIAVIALMNPYIEQGSSLCLLEWIGIWYCPGEGLGHSIAFFIRGDLTNAMQANILGPFSLMVLLARIGYLIKKNVIATS